MERIRTLIVEDEALFRELLYRTLEAEPTVEIVGESDNGESAVRMAQEVRVDSVIIDIELAGEMNGLEAAHLIEDADPHVGILVLSAHKDRRYLASFPTGSNFGWSYLLKQTVRDVATLVRAIQGSRNGMVMLDPAITRPSAPHRLALGPTYREAVPGAGAYGPGL